ncbi:hypothetical protein VR010_09440 [Actinomycetaceae bacterium L2_0104]
MPDRTDPEIPEDEFAARWAEITANLSDLDELDSSVSNTDNPHSPRPDAPTTGRSSHSSLLSPDSESLADTVPDDDAGTVSSRASGPRDWTPSEEEFEEGADLDFEDALDILNPSEGPSSIGSSHSGMLWMIAGGAILVSLLMAFSVLPGGGVFAGALGLVGFGCGAFAAFASAPHQEDIDPFDDGARL